MISLPDRLKQLRKSNNLTQTELGKILGVGKTTISMYETNNSTPNDEIKLKIAEYFNVSLDYLLGKTDIRNYTDDNNATIALHSDTDYDDLPEEARKEINSFIEFVKQKYKDKK
ncbi:helix-turn-helix transcriptional regulator [Clostridium butyricum]|uniref:helix-turn-helix domain-containing protein n=1 Tax=Clostridium butyricum TaxID=1492 RepID=UPI0006E6F17C|nr:helix-turn-helix transcriptional regulator [Clostridium butyricum]KQB77490.1 DNA-binding protein [Clostridium butyricum]MDB2161357.1 helix-turn-helix transcriptional regulator [Clostridium butyricum]